MTNESVAEDAWLGDQRERFIGVYPEYRNTGVEWADSGDAYVHTIWGIRHVPARYFTGQPNPAAD